MHSQNYINVSAAELINIITGINLLMMFIILIFRKQNTIPNVILAFILLLPSVNFINNYIILSGKIYNAPSIVFISQISAFLTAPLIYHYARIFMGKKKNLLSPLHALTILGIVACVLYWIKFLYFTEVEKIDFASDIEKLIIPSYLVNLRGLFFVLLNLYFIDLAIQVWKYSIDQFNITSQLEKIKLRYLQYFVAILWSLYIIILISYCFLPNFFVDFIEVPIITGIFYIFLLITGFNNATIFTKEDFLFFEKSVQENINTNLKSNNYKELEDSEVSKLHDDIRKLLEVERIFTDPDLNIMKLAKSLNCTPHHTSFFINNYLNTNFFNLINLKRIELAKKMMLEHGEKSEIEVIGYQVGFNSKSAFYRAFNKFVGSSPGEYIKSIEKRV